MLMNRRRPPQLGLFQQMVFDCYHISFDQETMIVDEEEPPTKQPTMTEICIDNNIGSLCGPSPSISQERPFKLLVKNQIFTIDSAKLSELSPVFRTMCFGRDFENGRELVREVVDENSQDIAIFLHCIHDHSLINEWNFAILLRLSNKYQVSSLANACGEYVLKSPTLDNVKADQVLTMLIAAHDYHQPLAVIKRLILRLAGEEKIVFTRLKVNRFLPNHLYTALISTNLNLTYLKQVEGMNGHLFRVEQNRVVFKRGLCVHCKKLVDAAECEGCRQFLCKDHAVVKTCTSEYGGRMLYELRQNIVEISEAD